MRNDEFGTVTRNGKLAPANSESAVQLVVLQKLYRIAAHFFNIADITQKSGFAIVDNFWNAADARGDDGNFASLRFQRGLNNAE